MTTQGNQSSVANPILYTKEIQDIYLRKNFQNLSNYFQAQNQLFGFNFFELNLTAATNATQTMNHNLGYLPKDIVISRITGSGTINFLFGLFTTTTIAYTATGPCRVRFFVGTYFNDTSTISQPSSDQESNVAAPLSSVKYTAPNLKNLSGSGAYTPTSGILYFRIRALGGSTSHTLFSGGTGSNYQSFSVNSTTALNTLITSLASSYNFTLGSGTGAYLIIEEYFQ